MSTPLLLTFNPGSSTIKIGLFSVTAGEATRIGQGMIDFRHQPLRHHLTNGSKTGEIPLKAAVTNDLHDVLDETLGWFATHFPLDDLVSVGHRVVHEGDRFAGPLATLANPLDLSEEAGPEHYRAAVAACAGDTQVDGILVIYSPQAGRRPGRGGRSAGSRKRHHRQTVADLLDGR